MGRELRPNTRLAAHYHQGTPYADPADAPAISIQKQVWRTGARLPAAPQELRPRAFEILLHRRQCPAPDWHQPLLITLSDAAQATRARVEVGNSQARQFRDAQPSRIQHFEDGAIAQTIRSR